MRFFQRITWKWVLCIGLCALLLKFIVSVSFHISCCGNSFPDLMRERCHLESGENLDLDYSFDASLKLTVRKDVQTCTRWRAPIIWEGMFDPDFYDTMHQMEGSSVALMVFAVGRYLDAYLDDFLESSQSHFMLSLPVTYYVFTDAPEKVPKLDLAPDRSLKVIKVERLERWQDISMMRMKWISDAIESDNKHRCTHVFCLDVDQVFNARFGSEALGDSVALLHMYYYNLPQSEYTYDRNPQSKAHMQTGDYYYHAAVFGGTWESVKAMVDACYQSIMEDKKNNVEALWHDESHLNKYLWLHKPSRVLSPEYCWDPAMGHKRDIQTERLLWKEKQYQTVRKP